MLVLNLSSGFSQCVHFMVEDTGFEPVTWPCKGRVFPTIPIPHCSISAYRTQLILQVGRPGRIRTDDQRLMRPLLWASKLPAQCLVRLRGLEPPLLSEQRPQRCASPNSATAALNLCEPKPYHSSRSIFRCSFFSVTSGGQEGIRTLDLCRAKAALSQLSYMPMIIPPEPATACMSPIRDRPHHLRPCCPSTARSLRVPSYEGRRKNLECTPGVEPSSLALQAST